jgi:hypothetical protein
VPLIFEMTPSEINAEGVTEKQACFALASPNVMASRTHPPTERVCVYLGLLCLCQSMPVNEPHMDAVRRRHFILPAKKMPTAPCAYALWRMTHGQFLLHQ